MLGFKEDLYNIEEAEEEAQVLLDLKFMPPKHVEGLVIVYDDGYFDAENGGKFIKGKPPANKREINGRKGFQRFDRVSLKYLIKAVPSEYGGFKIFTYSLNYIFDDRLMNWEVEHILNYSTNLNEFFIETKSALNYFMSITINSFIEDIIRVSGEIEMDLSELVMSIDPFCRNVFYDFFFDVLGLFEDREGVSRPNAMRDALRNVKCSSEEFEKNWTALFKYIELARTWKHLEIERMIKLGYENLLVDIFKDHLSPNMQIIEEENLDSLSILGLSEALTHSIAEFKWSHRVLTLQTIKRLSKKIETKKIIALLKEIDNLKTLDSDEKNKKLQKLSNKMLRENK